MRECYTKSQVLCDSFIWKTDEIGQRALIVREVLAINITKQGYPLTNFEYVFRYLNETIEMLEHANKYFKKFKEENKPKKQRNKK